MDKSYWKDNSWWRLILNPALAQKPFLGCHLPNLSRC